MTALAPAAALALLAASPAREERGEVERKLQGERAALQLIRSEKVSALEVLDLVERMERRAAVQVQQLEADLKLMKSRLQLAERQEAVANLALQEQLQKLSPRLLVMYRTTQRNPLEVLLSASDFAQLVWRGRALHALVESDLQLLQQVQRVRRFQELSHLELETVRGELGARLKWARAREERSRKQRQDLEDLLSLLQAEAVQSGRVVKDLEVADRELGTMIAEMEAPAAESGFGALKGRLSWPLVGRVEMGFGKLENPRFHTVTVQKGLDLRAPAGTPVRAVADGRVVFSGWLRGYGNLIILDHGDGYHTVVAHLGELERKVGEEVHQGEAVGPLGDTGSLKGAYVYFELRHHGVAVDPQVWLTR
ncbi:MAG TPA: peptidoglycan DD-metalloendopeptidase family protein [Myxococcales bacterium]|jgi:septal ring factor EnvC (AmiA/AmiB activator)|nr:peptidoglycan DD-metalloendopeptidase family protein [Myxococcales bacterium]